MAQYQKKTGHVITNDSIKSIEDVPLIDSILMSRSNIKAELEKSDEELALQTAGNKDSDNKEVQKGQESRLSTQYVDESQGKVKGSYGCELVTTESVNSQPQPKPEKLSRQKSASSEFSLDNENQNVASEENFRDQIREPKIGCFFFRFEVNDEGVTIKIENRDTFDLYTYNLKNEVLQQGLLGDLFESPQDFGEEIISLVKSYPNPFLEFDEDNVELTLFQYVDFGKKKARKSFLEMKLQNQSEFLKPLDLCKSSSRRLFADNPSENQKLLLKVTDQMILYLEELEKKTQDLHTNISKIEV